MTSVLPMKLLQHSLGAGSWFLSPFSIVPLSAFPIVPLPAFPIAHLAAAIAETTLVGYVAATTPIRWGLRLASVSAGFRLFSAGIRLSSAVFLRFYGHYLYMDRSVWPSKAESIIDWLKIGQALCSIVKKTAFSEHKLAYTMCVDTHFARLRKLSINFEYFITILREWGKWPQD